MSARDDIDPLLLQEQDAGLRRAALALHSLEPSDRAWMLSRLPDDRRGTLKPLLQELTELGIPADPRWRELAAKSHSRAQAEPAAALLPKHVGKVARVLESESAQLIAGFLSLGHAGWQESVKACLPEATAAQVEALIAGGNQRPLPPRLSEALLHRLDMLLECTQDSDVPAPRRDWMLRVLDRMKARR